MASKKIFENMKIVETQDGSETLYLPGLDEHYHSIHGAYTESMHVFIENGLHAAMEKFEHIRLLEVGFGTGLNIWLSGNELIPKNFKFHAYAVDIHPIKKDIFYQLNYPEFGNSEVERAFYDTIMRAEWNREVRIASDFYLEKVSADWTSHPLDRSFNLVYYDAFSPGKQPEMWSKALFEKVARHMLPGGILVTYTSKGEVRRNLEAAGLRVEKIPGPPGKREMLRATKEGE